jgi:hypothetical protein
MTDKLDVAALRRKARKYLKDDDFGKLKEDIKEAVVLTVLIESAIAVNPEAGGADRARFVKLAAELVSQLDGGSRESDDLDGVVR